MLVAHAKSWYRLWKRRLNRPRCDLNGDLSRRRDGVRCGHSPRSMWSSGGVVTGETLYFPLCVWVALLMWHRPKCLHIWQTCDGIRLCRPDGTYQQAAPFVSLAMHLIVIGEKHNKQDFQKTAICLMRKTLVREFHHDKLLSCFCQSINLGIMQTHS